MNIRVWAGYMSSKIYNGFIFLLTDTTTVLYI